MQKNCHQRVNALTHIEAAPDVTESLIRLLLYSNTMDIKGFGFIRQGISAKYI
jgi:hypothetical protein